MSREDILSRLGMVKPGRRLPAGRPRGGNGPGPEVAPARLARLFEERWTQAAGRFCRAGSRKEVLAAICLAAGDAPAGGLVLLADSALEIAPGLEQDLAAHGFETTRDPALASRAALGVTGAHAALASSGSLVLTSRDHAALTASLLPPVHVALVSPQALRPGLAQALVDVARPGSGLRAVVIITGPSKTADIGFSLIFGAHGPGRAHAVLVTG